MVVKVLLDFGHGGRDPGAVANGLREKDIVLKVGLQVRDMLMNEYTNVQVRLSRSSDVFVELGERSRLANEWRADYFVSFHNNAGGGTGFESYIWNGVVSNATIANQNIMHSNIMQRIGGVDRGKKRANFAVLRLTNMPAILTETLFVDRAPDAAKLKDPSFLTAAARGHTEGLANIFGLKKKPGGGTVNNQLSQWKLDEGDRSIDELCQDWIFNYRDNPGWWKQKMREGTLVDEMNWQLPIALARLNRKIKGGS